MRVHDLSVPIVDGVDWYNEADCPPVSLQRVVRREVTLCVAPLRLHGANAAPCRVLAW